MKLISERTVKGKTRLTVELEPGESLMTSVRADRYYELGYPIEDVVPSHVLLNAVQVAWCPVSQKWVE